MTKTSYVINGTRYTPTRDLPVIVNELPVGTYTVGIDENTKEFFLSRIDDFGKLGKVYGKADDRAERIANTFFDRDGSTGVLLVGEKGSGKTMLARMLSKKLADNGLPTIVINRPFFGDKFAKFLQSIDTPCLVIFDEFEKVYDYKEQEGMLTLLDGVYPSKKLFVLTSNSRNAMNQHLINRPGRLFYTINYTGISDDIIEAYCVENLKDKSHIKSTINFAAAFDAFNFDMLKALVEEMNRYGEDVRGASELMNISPETMDDMYIITAFNEKTCQQVQVDGSEQHISPLKGFSAHIRDFSIAKGGKPSGVPSGVLAELVDEDADEGDHESVYKHVRCGSFNVIGLNKGEYTFRSGDYKIIAKKKHESSQNVRELMYAA